MSAAITAEALKKRILAAKGEIPFDSCFYNCRVVDVYGERIIDNGVVGVCDGVIVSLCPTFTPQAEEWIDCGGMYLAPSFIDAHMHIESTRLTPYAYCRGGCSPRHRLYFYRPHADCQCSGRKRTEMLLSYVGGASRPQLYTASVKSSGSGGYGNIGRIFFSGGYSAAYGGDRQNSARFLRRGKRRGA